MVACALGSGVAWAIAFAVAGKVIPSLFALILLVAPAALPLAFWDGEAAMRTAAGVVGGLYAAAEVLSLGYGSVFVLLPAVVLIVAASLRRRG